MKFSRLYVPTTKETPKDAVLPSHIYLTRGGFILQVASGIYDFLPLGKRVLEKIRRIIREELDIAGCQEVELGFVTPADLWKKSNRFYKYGKELLRIYDRHANEFVLGPTHEEMMVELVKGRISSYKQLPLNLYQINLKFRDEARPRFGLMRGREFVMKDGYSFHADEEDMKREFALMEATYKKIFTRLGLDFRVVEADSGAIGGSGSKEFMVLAGSGEDTIVVCKGCEYAANIEAAKRKAPVFDKPEMKEEEVHTPGVTAIDEVAEFLKVPAHRCLKAVAKKALYDDREAIVVFFVRGTDELEETKATNAVHANELVDAAPEELEKAGIVPGFIGPEGLGEEVHFVVDNELKGETGLVAGANKADYHKTGVAVSPKWKHDDLVAVQEGDACPNCGGELHYTKGIEVGHIFQLGERYSKPLEANFLDVNGKSRPFVMGTYGIGVSRLVAAVIEQNHDDKGCIWSDATAPYKVEVIASNMKNEEEALAAEKLYEELKAAGVEVIFDDRKDRFGAKMADFELIGFPYAVIVGKKLGEGIVELATRKTLEKEEVKLEDVVEKIVSLCSAPNGASFSATVANVASGTCSRSV